VRSVGDYEAKTHLPRLLADVASGETVIITKHGRPVARLVPVTARAGRAVDAVTELRTARRGVRRGRDPVRRMIDDGRR